MIRFFPSAVETAISLALFYSFYWLFLRRETFFRWNRIYLLATLGLSFAIPALRLPAVVSAPVLEPIRRGGEGLLGALPAAGLDGPTAPAGWGNVLTAAYLAGAALYAFRLCLYLLRLRSVVRRNGVSRRDGLKVVPVAEDIPAFSFLGYVFINEGNISGDALRQILAHERVHIRQGHTLDILFAELAAAAQWFNPACRAYKKSLREVHEYLADRGAVAQGFSPQAYRRLVIEQHVGGPLAELAHGFRQSQILRRVKMMSQNESRKAARAKFALALPLALFLIWAFAAPRQAVPAAGPNPALQKDTASKEAQEKDIRKEKIAQAKAELESLRVKQADLKKRLAVETDPHLRQELETALASVQKQAQELEQYLLTNGLHPASPKESSRAVEAERLERQEVETREALEAATESAKRAELEIALQKAMAARAQIKIREQMAIEEAEMAKLQEKMKERAAAEEMLKAKLQRTQEEIEKARIEMEKATAVPRLSVTADKLIHLESSTFNLGALAKELEDYFAGRPLRGVRLEADPSLPYGYIVEIIDVLKSARIEIHGFTAASEKRAQERGVHPDSD